MDTVINAALEEICVSSQWQNGVALSDLWSKLQPCLSSANLDLSQGVKQALWSNILRIPALLFRVKNDDRNYTRSDPSIQSVENAEKLNLKIDAQQSLKDSFIGLYKSNLPPNQRRALERIVNARTDGITQSQLGKELGIEGRNMFYVLRNLEAQGLIVRQSAVERKKETCVEGESKNQTTVTTNLIYLNRYAKNLGPQKRYEINKEEDFGDASANDSVGDCIPRTSFKVDIHVKDFEPKLKAVVDKLERADGKVLVVADIKKVLGYSGSSSAHKAWRQVCRRLKATHSVEEFDANVNGKVESCLRLVETSTTLPGDEDQKLKCGKECQLSNQFVELPLDHQIYDTIDAVGSSGLTSKELCEKFGMNQKKIYNRLVSMLPRFKMKQEGELQERVKIFRLWTSRNFNSEPGSSLVKVPNSGKESKLIVPSKGAQYFLQNNDSSVDKDADFLGEINNTEQVAKVSSGLTGGIESNPLVFPPTIFQEPVLEPEDETSDLENRIVSAIAVTDTHLSVTPTPAALKALTTGSPQQISSVHLTVDGAKREKRILEKLQEEKFVLKPEIQRWLASFEKDKRSTIDRKTIDRILIKLQQEGRCICRDIQVPIITNYNHKGSVQVVFHPSIQNFTRELLSEVQDRVRSFKMQIRSQCSSRQKEMDSIPILNDIQRTPKHRDFDTQAIRAEAMRANGFVLAKMVRAKLLHGFFWDYVDSSSNCSNAPSSNASLCKLINPHSTSKLFPLEAAVKTIPLELFLQVAGSTKKCDGLIEKCKNGLQLSDLAQHEYNNFMDTRAIGRLSLVVDILRRLKLIRLVADVQSKDGAEVSHSGFTHALELKPYIEEPISRDALSLPVRSVDLRPRIRHDFFLSNREAVDKYWQTLEFCYTAADKEATLYAFPGSAVREVLHHRSWASIRPMTAEQHSKHQKHVVDNDLSIEMSYVKCEQIAKDLNLTSEQVLRLLHGKHLMKNEFQPLGRKRASLYPGKGYSEGRPPKFSRIETTNRQFSEHRVECHYYGSTSMGQECTSPREQDTCFQEDDNLEIEEHRDKDEGHHPFLGPSVLSRMKQTRQRRFLWTDETDRTLITQYVRHRAMLGAKYHRADWTVLSNLPAGPNSCKKRMAWLNSNIRCREAIMKLCNLLSERYVQHLKKTQSLLLESDCRFHAHLSLDQGTFEKSSCNSVADVTAQRGEAWDDFENIKIKNALNQVLWYKKMAKLEASKSNASGEEWANEAISNGNDSEECDVIAPSFPNEAVQRQGEQHQKVSNQGPRRHRLDKKFTKLFANGANCSSQVHESLAISSAVELFKLVFLTTSTSTANLLAEILRRYSEHDLFAAFNYLREKKIMIGGYGYQFELSQQFLHNVTKSPFPSSTGKKAAKFARWLSERNKDLLEGGTGLDDDLQCGDVFYLFGIVVQGELSIIPHLPENGVGEIEDSRSFKRKLDNAELPDADKTKKIKSLSALESDVISRREKGFPGIIISVHLNAISRSDTIDMFKDENTCNSDELYDWNTEKNSGHNKKSDCNTKEFLGMCDAAPVIEAHAESPWEGMAAYARHLILMTSNKEQVGAISVGLFKYVYAAIQKAGDQGLSVEEISQIVKMPGVSGTCLPGLVINVLQAFRRALKVNAYNSVRVVDTLYRYKYFFTSCTGSNHVQSPSTKSDSNNMMHTLEESAEDCGKTLKGGEDRIDNIHKVTILNLPEENVEPSNAGEALAHIFPGNDCVCKESMLSSGAVCMPILPWMNADGTINQIVYKGLVRRVLGIVMQNPGILEENIIQQMETLNPQNCRTLLELMILDKHLSVRKILQTKSEGPPSLLCNLLGSTSCESKSICLDHYFANPTSTELL